MNQTVVIGVGSLMVGLLGSLLGVGGMRLKGALADIEALKKQAAAAQTVEGGGNQATPRENVLTDFNEDVDKPQVARTAYLDAQSAVIGDVELGERVYVGPFASLRGDEGQPLHIGDDSNVQDGVVVHALETVQDGKTLEGRTYNVGGRDYAVYVGNRVSLAHQALVHGPARIDDSTFVGMQAMVFKAWVGAGCVIEPGARVIGVVVPPGRYVPAGAVINTQEEADALPSITPDYAFRDLNDAVVHVNTSFSSGYRGKWPVGKGADGEHGAATGHGEGNHGAKAAHGAEAAHGGEAAHGAEEAHGTEAPHGEAAHGAEAGHGEAAAPSHMGDAHAAPAGGGH